MSSSHLLTRYRQSASSFSATNDNTAPTSSRSNAVSEDWLSRPLPPHFITRTPTPARSRPLSSHSAEPPDLFTTLLFDRRKAYDQNARLPAPEVAIPYRTGTPSTIAHQHCHFPDVVSRVPRKSAPYDRESAFAACRSFSRSSTEKLKSPNTGMSLVSHLKDKQQAPKVSKRRAKVSKKIATNKKKKMTEVTSKKRQPQDDEDLNQRPSKNAKTEAKANIGRKVGNSSTNVVVDTPLGPEVIYISDSEDEKSTFRNEEQPAYLPKEPNTYTPRNALQLGFSSPPTDELYRQSWLKVDSPDTVSDLTPELISNANDSAKAMEELQKLRQELHNEREKSKDLQQKLEEINVSLLLKDQTTTSEREQETAFLKRELEVERHKTRVAAKQCEQLLEQLRGCHEDLAKQKKVETEREAQLTENVQMKSDLEHEHDCLRDTLRKSNAEAKDLRSQIKTLQDDKTRLTAEVQSLKTAASSSFCPIPALSPVPSLCSSSTAATEEEIKTENVRKTYIKVKRQFDILQAAAASLVTCTRSMDLSSFGDFGKDMRKLRSALELDGRPPNSREDKSSFVGKADDNDDPESQRSRG